MKRICVVIGVVCLAIPSLVAGNLEDRVSEAAMVTWVHGMTQEIADREVGVEGAPYLKELLADPTFPRRDNVAAMLIFLGNDADATALADALLQPVVRAEDFRARMLVPEALGRIASRGGSLAYAILNELANDPATQLDSAFAQRVEYGMSLVDPPAQEEIMPAPEELPEEPLVPLVDDTSSVIHQHVLTYSNHVDTNSPIDAARVETILEAITGVIGVDNGGGDTGCCNQLVRGAGATFGTPGDGRDTINNSSESAVVMGNTSGRVKIVDFIGYCGGPGANIIGCGTTPGTSIAVVRISAVNLEGQLWAHEYGHNTGLGHHAGTGFIMTSFIATNHTRLNTFECSRFHFPHPAANALISLNGVCHDDDNDAWMSSADNCPYIFNIDQADMDNDGLGNACDNCISVPNPDQIDCDLDDIGDVCDPENFIPPEVENILFADKTTLTWPPTVWRPRNIYQGSSSDSLVLIGTVAVGVSFPVPDVPPSGVLFYYQVTAFNDCGEGP